MRQITFRRMCGSYWGAGQAYICGEGLRRHTDIPPRAETIQVVALKSADPDDPDCFDVRKDGTLEGVGLLDHDFRDWLRQGARKGYDCVYVNEIVDYPRDITVSWTTED